MTFERVFLIDDMTVVNVFYYLFCALQLFHQKHKIDIIVEIAHHSALEIFGVGSLRVSCQCRG